MSGGVNIIGNQSVLSRMVALTGSNQQVSTTETTTSTTYTNLTTSGPAITLTTGATQARDLHYNARIFTNSAGSEVVMAPSLSGNAASDSQATLTGGDVTNRENCFAAAHYRSGVSSGDTDTLKYRVTANTGSYQDRTIRGIAL